MDIESDIGQVLVEYSWNIPKNIPVIFYFLEDWEQILSLSCTIQAIK
jgi:hypothetical protein